MRRQDKKMVIDNFLIYQYYKERLENLALTEFVWDGFPDTCDPDYFERCLLYKGKAAIYKPKRADFFLSTGFATAGSFNGYGYPDKIIGIDFNGHNIETDEFFMVWDNKTRQTLIPKIELHAKLLWEIHNTIRANLFHQRIPYVAPIDKTELISYQSFIDKLDGFSTFIPVKKSFDLDTIKTVDLKVPYIGNELFDLLRSEWAEALSMLGITAETTKKERLISDEIMINRQEDILSVNSRLSNRQKLCDEINEKYNLNLSVRMATFTEDDLKITIPGSDEKTED